MELWLYDDEVISIQVVAMVKFIHELSHQVRQSTLSDFYDRNRELFHRKSELIKPLGGAKTKQLALLIKRNVNLHFSAIKLKLGFLSPGIIKAPWILMWMCNSISLLERRVLYIVMHKRMMCSFQSYSAW